MNTFVEQYSIIFSHAIRLVILFSPGALFLSFICINFTLISDFIASGISLDLLLSNMFLGVSASSIVEMYNSNWNIFRVTMILSFIDTIIPSLFLNVDILVFSTIPVHFIRVFASQKMIYLMILSKARH